MSEMGKREVPPALKQLLEFDKKVTEKFVLGTNSIVPLRNLSCYCKGLEFSCHGIPWFAFWIAFTWLFNDQSYIQMQVNMLIGLFMDIVFIAVAKAYFRRRRPLPNKDDALGQVGPDIFSFPSGHASRAVYVAYFFLRLHPVSVILMPVYVAWAAAVCVSRVLLNRHYLLDVLGGVVLGLSEGFLLSLLWLDESTAKWLMSFLSDEQLDGGEYHV